MGDRGNIVIETPAKKAELFLYTHWTGSNLPRITAAGLRRGRGRWGDPAYLNRILFSEMIQKEVLDETGYGISTTMCDGGTEVYVCHEKQTVRYAGTSYSFSEFTEAF